MTIYDLSVPVVHGRDWYGEAGCPPVSLEQVGGLDQEGWVSHNLVLMVLNGTTYLETGAHLHADMPTLDEVPPERFIARAFVVALDPANAVGRGRASASPPCALSPPPADLLDFRPDQDAILLHCGWDSRVDADDYYHASPYFSADLQAWLLNHRPAILGGDMLSFDHPKDVSMPFLRTFFRGGGMILCPLLGLATLPSVVTLCCAPVRLTGSSAAPCRALAWAECPG